ncbi:MAG: EamA family transporter [Flavobacteriales bacterium]
MINLIITITTFSAMVMLFKYFDKIGVNNLTAITFNYFTAGILALFSYRIENSIIELKSNVNLNLLICSLIVGVLFVITFNLYAFTAQKIGITLSTIANKMSMIIPILIGLILFKEEVTLIKVIGIFLAIGAIIFSSKEDKKSKKLSQVNMLILSLLFIGQGLADGILNWAQKNILNSDNMNLFFTLTFLSAGLAGGLYIFYKIKTSNFKMNKKSILWGITLGIPNYLTLLYFMKSLKNDLFSSYQVFPIVNIGVIVLCTILSVILFKEKVSFYKWIGVGFGILAISLILF